MLPTCALIIACGLASAPAEAPKASTDADCLGCHGDKGFGRKGPGGQKVSLHTDKKQLKASVHADLSCDSCHPGITTDNHTDGEKRGQSAAVYKACRGCHEPGKTVHGRMMSQAGSLRCSRCHGKHGIRKAKVGLTSCRGCHGRTLTVKRGSGKRVTLKAVDGPPQGAGHRKLTCASCHQGHTLRKHPATAGGKLARLRRRDASCRKCHGKVSKLLREGVHQRVKAGTGKRRPGCSDCHHVHSATAGAPSASERVARCQQCHRQVFAQYAKSVHGAAVIGKGSKDVPGCSDCHRAHDIRNPGAPGYRARIPDLCGNCHADRKRMRKYGLSSQVLTSYLDDFHGVTLRFYRKEKRDVRRIAVCVDCHGIHDIASTRGKNKKHVKRLLLDRCRKCHPKATTAFPDAWVSHWIPSATRTPLVYWITWFYRILIPLMLIGLGLQVVLHFWRFTVKR